MRKILIIMLVLLLSSSTAFAALVGSSHDLATVAENGSNTEVCVYCHTPHGADTSVTRAPLWNRSTNNATGSVYVGLDLQATMTLTSVNQTDAPLCLSCHDGTIDETLQNEPNAFTTDVTGYTFSSTAANLGTDMSNDHPVGFDYDAVATADSEIRDAATVEANAGMAGAVSYDGGSTMWCSSCHDVHDDSVDFLRVANTNSQLCTYCHIK